MGQLVEGCGIPLEDWLPHHKMAAVRITTSPRMQQDPPRCRCSMHLIEAALKSGGSCCVRARETQGERLAESRDREPMVGSSDGEMKLHEPSKLSSQTC